MQLPCGSGHSIRVRTGWVGRAVYTFIEVRWLGKGEFPVWSGTGLPEQPRFWNGPAPPAPLSTGSGTAGMFDLRAGAQVQEMPWRK